MSNNIWSKLTWLILGIVPLLLIACGGSSSTPAVPESATVEPAAPTAEPIEAAVEEPTTEPVDAVEEVEAETEDEIVPVAAKPQLIEFYADW